ncbi:unnamed protein product [Ceratitis capitata]|uniref:protein-tyrosine-phosphatase n=2 Tax=Ceratitis capitata TaxID=7213 RepID=A0A811U0A3_CERCA|nr:unnamed protein product [Ceratitis capitata]
MSRSSTSRLWELLILALIIQALASALPHTHTQLQRRHLSRRSLESALRDHDIAAMAASDLSDQNTNDDAENLKSKSSEGADADATADTLSESENTRSVKSTKLLPAFSNNGADNAGEHKSGETLVLNRVESREVKSAAGHEAKEVMEENESNTKDGSKDVSTGHQGASEVTNSRKFSEEEEESKADVVFSHADDRPKKPLATVNLERHINNGLDEMTLRADNEKLKSEATLDEKATQPATTEEILKDLENVALKVIMTTPRHADDANDRLEGVGKQDMSTLQTSMGRSMDTAQSNENKLEVVFGEKPIAETVLLTAEPILATKPMLKEMEEKEKELETETKQQETGIETKATIDNHTATQDEKLSYSNDRVVILEEPLVKQITAAEEMQKQARTTSVDVTAGPFAGSTKHSEVAHGEETRENLQNNRTSTHEKRGKFFNDNSTNVKNMNLPDGPEVWSLAGMRMVPKTIYPNDTAMLLADTDSGGMDPRWQANEIVTTERTMNVSDYSEKNLLDWSKVMGMRDEFEKNHLTDEASKKENEEIVEMSNSKVVLPTQSSENWKTEGPSRTNDSAGSNIPALSATEGVADLKAGEQLSTTHTFNEIDTIQGITTATGSSGSTTTNPPTVQISHSSSSPLSVGDKSDKQAVSISTNTTAGVGEPLNDLSPTSTESSTLRQNEEKTGVEVFSAAVESSTQRQSSDDFNFIITSTTPLIKANVTADVNTATEVAINDTTTPTTTALPTATLLAALPVEHSTSTASPPILTEVPKHSNNATVMNAQPETTEFTQPASNADAGVRSGSAVTLEQHLKREPETETEAVTVTAATAEEQATSLAVSEQSTSEANGLISAGEQKAYVNVNASVTAGEEGVATQNEAPSVTTETTTESNQIAATTTTIISIVNTTVLSTDLVETNVSEKTIKVLAVTATTTEVAQIGNEVELDVRTEPITDIAKKGPTDTAKTTLNSDTGSSTIVRLEETTAADIAEANTTAKTVSSINELLVPVNITTTTTTAKATPLSTTAESITTPPTQVAVEQVLHAATTLKSDEKEIVKEATTTIIPLETTVTVQASGSVLENSTAATTPTPVATQHRTAVAAEGTHDTESSIETNVIDQQLDKTAVKITNTTISAPTTTTTTEAIVAEEDVREKVETETEAANGVSTFQSANVNNVTTLPDIQDTETTAAISTTTTPATTTISTTTMAAVPLSPESTIAPQIPVVNGTNISATTTSTTEPPLISLLDESTTTTSMTSTLASNQPSTTTSSVVVNPQEVYTVVSTTENASSTSTSTTAATYTPAVPIATITSTSDAPVVSSSTNTYTTTVASTIATVTTTILPPTLQATIGIGGSGAPSHPPSIISAGIRPNSSDANETDVNVIIAITVSIIGVVALILLVAFLYLMRKRQKQMSYGQRCRPVSLDAYSLDNVSVLGSVRRKGALRASKRSYGNIAFDDPSLRHNALSASELAKFVERRSSIFEEFRDVPQIIARADEVPPGCEDKNRYANVIPLPETRVVLQQLGDDDKTEYINANYVRGPKDSPNYYIATQAPLETTVVDFWRMIWEQESRVIIQATDLYENGIEKCAEYLPPSVTLDNHTTYGDFQITLKHREVKDKYAISTLLLKNTAENMSRELTHYWYKWPEAGVPSEEAPIIAMLLEARSSLKGYVNEAREKGSSGTLKADGNGETLQNGNGVTVITVDDVSDKTEAERVNGAGKENAEINGNVSAMDKMRSTTLRNQGPLTIHCSPGTGRTGTIIACDMAIRSLETPKRSVDIPQIVYYVRRGRASAVQTKEQYEFIYKVAHMYATKITNLSNDN